MIARVVDFSVRNKLVVFAAVAVAALAGWWSIARMPLDAIPDLSDTQVIVYSRWDRSPDLVEDQVTYPIVTAMLGAPGVRAVRGFSDFGYSFVYVIFEEGTDIYWARSRTLEYLSPVIPSLPAGVKTELGPDALGLGWVFQYALVDETGKRSLADLRSLQDWYLRYHLRAVPGVAEVAAVGGYQKQYQVNVDPARLRAYGIPIQRVAEAVRGGNVETGARLIEFGGTEYMVRGRGYARTLEDFEEIVVSPSESGSPIRVRDIGQVTVGPDLRRGIAELDGRGEVVSGIVVMRQGQNALEVIDRVKKKLVEIGPGLPDGVRLVTAYDRSDLIRRAIRTLTSSILEVIVTISVIIMLFLWHLPSALIPVITIPLAVLIAFIPFGGLGLTANIMSLGGIAIAIGALDDAAIVVVEQTHKKLEEWERGGRIGDYRLVVQKAITQVAGPSFFSLLVIGVSFIPVLALEAQEGRLFKPLAYTKTLAMLVAAVLAVTLDPALRMLLTRPQPFAFRPAWLRRTANTLFVGTIRQEERHPVSRVLMRIYAPIAAWTLRRTLARLRGGAAARGGHRPGVLPARHGVHAAARGGLAVLHADHDARHLGHRGRAAAAGDGPDHQVLPGGRARPRQGRARRHLHRPGAALDARDRRHAQAEVRVAQGRHLVLLLGAGVAEGPAAAHHPRHDLPGAAHRGDERGAAAAGALERLDDADQGAHRHARHRHPHAGRPEDLRLRPRRDRADRRRGRDRCSRGCAAPAACSPSAPRAGTSSTSSGSGASWRATGSPCRRPRTCSPRRWAARA